MLESNNKDARTQYCSLSSLVVTDFELIELIGNRFLMCLRVMYFSDGKLVSGTVAIHLNKDPGLFSSHSWLRDKIYPAGIYLLKVNNKNTRTRCEICSELTIMTLEWSQWCRSVVFIVNFEHILQLVLVFLSLTSNM